MKAAIPMGLALALLSLDAQAISRYDSQNMTCDRVQSVLRQEGAVILRYKSRSGAPLYDRYVTNSGFCNGTEITRLYSVPTSDNNRCKVFKCFDKSYDK